ncbi:diphthine-ammonia ligase [Aureococcus anophagefferens]|uniref:Diphthine--ammonia ligase n=2 Tax=Aureococcus anophagefferens TaxID=44056 RepID=A0ABR1FYG9_AURAN
MKFVQLLSGGKDSVFSLIQAEKHGHELVCVANLHPLDEGADELDSFCFQSAAHGAVAGVAACLDTPLVRRPITGGATKQGLVYAGAAAGDEVEDLYELLKDVKARFPAVEAVSSGAIYSTYQRTRVEDVCARLGLRSMSYLWRRDQRKLLKDMGESKLRAVVVKTASMGLEPGDHLGLRLDLASTRRLFRGLHESFGFHECGEGGEYESLVLDSPRFAKRLVLEDATAVRLDDMPKGCGSVGVLSVKAWNVAEKEEDDEEEDEEEDDTDDAGEEERSDVEDITEHPQLPPPPLDTAGYVPAARPPLRASGGHGTRGVTCVDAARAATSPAPSADAKAAAVAQITAALRDVAKALASRDLTLRAVFFVHLYLKDLAHFGAVNEAYVAEFQRSFAEGDSPALHGARPPSRSCVAAPLPPGVEVLVDVECAPEGREALYVRSLSEWAPVCIGPYCQANTLRGALVFAAGQIHLDPPTMTLEAGSLAKNLRTSFAHAASVLDACHARLGLYESDDEWDATVSLVVYVVGHGSINASCEAAGVTKTDALVVEVPALPMGAKCEVEVVAATRRFAPFLRRWKAVSWTATVAPRCLCAAVAWAESAASVDAAVREVLAGPRSSPRSPAVPWTRRP